MRTSEGQRRWDGLDRKQEGLECGSLDMYRGNRTGWEKDAEDGTAREAETRNA